jgi:hypothetical protein
VGPGRAVLRIRPHLHNVVLAKGLLNRHLTSGVHYHTEDKNVRFHIEIEVLFSECFIACVVDIKSFQVLIHQ